MKKIIPFKKDILFKTNLAEVTSISLENTLKIEEHSVSGDFIVNGEYKITDTSRDTEKFLYELPFSIAFDPKYKLENAIIDIDDFYYEIINNSTLRVNIEVSIDNIEEKLIEEIEERVVEEDKRCIEEEESKNKTNLLNAIDTKETYSTYKVYIVRENDTIESIIDKYGINKETLEIYNDLSDLKIGDKLIIPVTYEGN